MDPDLINSFSHTVQKRTALICCCPLLNRSPISGYTYQKAKHTASRSFKLAKSQDHLKLDKDQDHFKLDTPQVHFHS